MKLVNNILDKIFNFYLFKRKSINSSYKTNSNYFENNEHLINEFLNNKIQNVDSYNDANKKLSSLLHKFFKSNNFDIIDFANIISGKLIYNRTGITPDNLQQLLVKNYSRSNGLFQDILHELLYKDYFNSYDTNVIESEIFGIVSSVEIDTIVEIIRTEGYVILPKLLAIDKVNNIKEWSYNLNYNVVDNQEKRFAVNNIDFQNPNCVTANAIESDLLNNPVINSIVYDPVIISIISKYLGIKKPSLIHLCMWWSFQSKNNHASSEAAQLFHYDLDHIKWLKVFFYLTDVGEEQGPHIYVPSSHISGNKNYALLERGYSRVSDSEMNENQLMSPKKVLGPAGSIIIGDTKCFHKGSSVISGARLVLQPTFGPSNLLKNNKI
jgi:hypothetical protein